MKTRHEIRERIHKSISKSILWHVLLRYPIIFGWLAAPESPMLANYIFIFKLWTYFGLFISVLALLLVLFKGRDCIKDKQSDSLLSIRIVRKSWYDKFHTVVSMALPVMFIGVVMGKWSLFFPMLAVDATGLVFRELLMSDADAIAEEEKKLDAKELAEYKAVEEELADDPLTRMIKGRRLAKERQDKQVASIADGVIGELDKDEE